MKIRTLLICFLASSLLFVSQAKIKQSFDKKDLNMIFEEEKQIHIPVTGTRYRSAQLSESYSAPAVNVNVVGKADVVTQATIDNKTVATCTPGKQTPQNEVTGAVNPGNPNNVVVGCNDYRIYSPEVNAYDGSGGFYRTTNGGKTWKAGFLPGILKWNHASPGNYENIADPSISASVKNVFWFCTLAVNRNSLQTGIAVSRSINSGASWKTTFPVEIKDPSASNIIISDKPWLAAHPSDPNIAYITWTQFRRTKPERGIAYTNTSDGGLTWTKPKLISQRDFNQGSVVVIDNLAVVHTAWMTSLGSANGFAYASKSGKTFGPTRILARIDHIASPVAWAHFYTNSFPSLAVDGQTLHGVWPNWNGKDADIVYIRSTNGGRTWSKPVAIADDPQDQFLPRVAARNGLVAVGYLDHNKESESQYHVSMVSSVDNGTTWTKPLKVSNQSSDPEKGNRFGYPDCLATFIGDYNGIDIDSKGGAHLFWTDIRRGNSPGDPENTFDQDAYFARVQIK
ncbi:MAG TPA: sialidase family protein [Acidobacteriota bacterium]|nr:sialidase family protein [Acidobacteriota bacterium]